MSDDDLDPYESHADAARADWLADRDGPIGYGGSRTNRTWFLIELGCAECGDMPLAMPRGVYPSESEARAAIDGQVGVGARWIAHPEGGSFIQWGSGGYWCAPIETLSKSGTEFGGRYDEAFR